MHWHLKSPPYLYSEYYIIQCNIYLWYFLTWHDVCIEQQQQKAKELHQQGKFPFPNITCLINVYPFCTSSSSAIYFSVLCILFFSSLSSSIAHFQAFLVCKTMCKFRHLRHSQINHRYTHYKQETLMSSLRCSIICALINWLSHLILDYIKYPKAIILILNFASCKNLI